MRKPLLCCPMKTFALLSHEKTVALLSHEEVVDLLSQSKAIAVVLLWESRCFVVPRESRCFVVPQRTGCFVVPRRSGCFVVPWENSCFVTLQRSSCFVTTWKSGCFVVLRKSSCFVVPQAHQHWSCPTGYIGYNYQCYVTHTTPKSWAEAQQACRTEGAELASLSNQQENEFLFSIIPNGELAMAVEADNNDGGSREYLYRRLPCRECEAFIFEVIKMETNNCSY